MDISLSIQNLSVKKRILSIVRRPLIGRVKLRSKVSLSEFYDLWEKVSSELKKKMSALISFRSLLIKISTLNYNYHAAKINQSTNMINTHI